MDEALISTWLEEVDQGQVTLVFNTRFTYRPTGMSKFSHQFNFLQFINVPDQQKVHSTVLSTPLLLSTHQTQTPASSCSKYNILEYAQSLSVVPAS